MNGLKTTISILLQFLFLLFRVFGEHFCFAMGQCHGDFSQSTAQFLKLVGRQRCLSTHPLSALLVEINRGAILICFILEYRQRHERRPRSAQDGFHLGLLPWGGESSNVALNESHDSSQKPLAAIRPCRWRPTFAVAPNTIRRNQVLSSSPQLTQDSLFPVPFPT